MLYFAVAGGFLTLVVLVLCLYVLNHISGTLNHRLATIAERAGQVLTDEERDRIANHEREVKAVRRMIEDLDESTDARFKRWSARAQRAGAQEPQEPEPREDPAQVPIAFGAPRVPMPFGASRANPAPANHRAFGGAQPFGGR